MAAEPGQPGAAGEGILVVGAGLAGLRTAEALRSNGYSGPLEIVGAEPHLPYNRPPLSKQALATGPSLDTLVYPRRPTVADVTWTLGRAALAADLDRRTVTLDDGTSRAFTGLVIATGVGSRRLGLGRDGAEPMLLRTLDDAIELRAELGPGVRLVIVGAGFIGCEVAATAAGLGAEVLVVDPLPAPLAGVLGRRLGDAVRARLEALGVYVRTDTAVRAVTVGTDLAEPARYAVHLAPADGSAAEPDPVPADVVLEAVGSVPNVDWLAGTGLELSAGVRCDEAHRVLRDGIPLPYAVAVGDVARLPHPLLGELRIEHWTWPGDTAARSARSLLAGLGRGEPPQDPLTALPSFWSDLPGGRIQSFGLPQRGHADVRLLEGDWDGECAVGYHVDGRLVGVALIGLARRMMHYREALLHDLTV